MKIENISISKKDLKLIWTDNFTENRTFNVSFEKESILTIEQNLIILNSLIVYDFFIKENSSIKYDCFLNSVGKDSLFKCNIFLLNKYSNFIFNLKIDKSSNLTVEINFFLNDTNTEVFLNSKVLVENENKINFKITVNHYASFTESKIKLNSVVENNSVFEYKGLIFINENIKEIKAIQINKNLLLDATSKAVSSPNLEILSNDVECGHSSFTCSLDVEQIWYLNLRSISDEQSIKLIKYAFLNQK